MEENIASFTYNLYYVSKSYNGPASNGSGAVPGVITGENYMLEKATFKVGKLTGKVNLNTKETSWEGFISNSDSCYSNIKTIRFFSEDKY